ncbi:MAG: hypothetical protein NC038_05820 [Paludibacter sp.]|nr:hypothetical protein [Bacteroidales bacterium]MCM1069267.1 hypothetical protein [Prevotella sp.]MCM1353750.1 hypothetical protein [Bacteroides sp.]MCM1442182.1 hypothetical protein [Muribaculum sp.]MCM1482144.1 hypothetical protein [Paludibacter sp.]
MKKQTILCLLASMVIILSDCSVQRSQAYYNYESRIIATELDGSYTLRAFGKGRNAVDAYEEAQKQAVYDVLFNGVKSADSKVQPLRPLLTEVNAKEKYAEYFNVFFADNGAYKKYCSKKERRVLTSNFSRTDAQTMAEVTVCVFRSQLEKKLREDGILK